MLTDRIDGVLIDTDEDGFALILSGEKAEYRLNVQAVALELLRAVEAEIGPWAAEAASVRRIFDRCTVDESGGLADLGSKHPDWHSVHADHYYNREKV